MLVYTLLSIDFRLDLLSTRVYLVSELTYAVVRSEHEMLNTNGRHLLGPWFQRRVDDFRVNASGRLKRAWFFPTHKDVVASTEVASNVLNADIEAD